MMARNRPNLPHPKPFRQKRFVLAFIFGLIAIISLATGFFIGTRYLIQGPYLKKILTSRIQSQLSIPVSIEQLSFKWTSIASALIEGAGLQIGNANKDPVQIHVARIEMSVDFQGAIFGNLEIGFLNISSPKIILDSHSVKSYIPQLPSDKRPYIFLNPLVKSIRIKDASILEKRNGAGPNHAETLFSKIEFSAGNLSSMGLERFEAQGLSHDGSRTGRVELSGTFETFEGMEDSEKKHSSIKFRLLDYPTYALSHLINSFYPEIPILHATTNAHIQVTGSWESWKALGSVEVTNFSQLLTRPNNKIIPERISASIEGYKKADRVVISIPSMIAPGIEASIETHLAHLGSGNASVTINVRKADLNLDEVVKIAPLKLLNPADRERVLKAGLRGKIKILSASWNYRLDAKQRPKHFWSDVVLDASFNQVTAFVPGLDTPIENTSGALRFNSDEVLFKGINVTIGSSPIVMNGWINNLSTKPKMDLFVSMKAQAADLQNLVAGRSLGEKFDSALKWVQEPGGVVSVTMDLKGDLEKPSMKGQIDFDDFHFKTDTLGLPVRKVSGSLRFRPSSISTSAIKGFIGESPFELKGALTDKESHANFEMKFNASDFKKMSAIGPGWSMTGVAPLTVNMKGRYPDINFSGAMDLKNLIIIKDSWIKKPTGVPLDLEFSGFRNSEGFSVDDAYLVSDSSRISARAQFREDGRIAATINLPPKGIPTSQLTWIADPILELQPGGRIEGDVNIRKDKNQDTNVEANFILNHVSLRLPRARKRTDGMTGTIQIKGKSLQLIIERSKTGSSLIAADVTITDFAQPKYRAHFDCEFLDTTDFTDQSAQAPVMTWIDWIRSNSIVWFVNQARGTGSLKVTKGKTAYRTFSDFRSDFEGHNGMVSVPKWQMNFADGVLRGAASFDVRPNTTRPLKIDFQGDHLKFDRIFVYDPNRVRVDGDVTSQGYMEWRIRSGIENGGVYKTGNMEVRVADGTIYRFEVLSKIFSLINLGSILRGRLPDVIGNGLPFQRINWKMDVFDNKWKIKDLKFYSDSARIDASGMYFSDQGRIDFKVDVAPLVGFDTILSGLFGNLITRDGKILNTTFRVRGLTSSPDVRLEPFENLKQEIKQGS